MTHALGTESSQYVLDGITHFRAIGTADTEYISLARTDDGCEISINGEDWVFIDREHLPGIVGYLAKAQGECPK